MSLRWSDWPADVLATLRRGAVIPAHPLALDANRKFDERRQRALSRYYLDAGAGGLAVGVHTTQFAIREVGLYRPVLEQAAATARERAGSPGWSGAPSRRGARPISPPGSATMPGCSASPRSRAHPRTSCSRIAGRSR